MKAGGVRRLALAAWLALALEATASPGDHAAQARDYEAARALYEEEYRKSPDEHNLCGLAEALCRLERHAQALQLLQAHAGHEPSGRRVWLHMQALWQQRDFTSIEYLQALHGARLSASPYAAECAAIAAKAVFMGRSDKLYMLANGRLGSLDSPTQLQAAAFGTAAGPEDLAVRLEALTRLQRPDLADELFLSRQSDLARVRLNWPAVLFYQRALQRRDAAAAAEVLAFVREHCPEQRLLDLAQGKLRMQEGSLSRAFRLRAAAAAAAAAADPRQAGPLLEEARRLNPGDAEAIAMQQAFLADAQGRHEEALQLLEASASLSVDGVRQRLRLGLRPEIGLTRVLQRLSPRLLEDQQVLSLIYEAAYGRLARQPDPALLRRVEELWAARPAGGDPQLAWSRQAALQAADPQGTLARLIQSPQPRDRLLAISPLLEQGRLVEAARIFPEELTWPQARALQAQLYYLQDRSYAIEAADSLQLAPDLRLSFLLARADGQIRTGNFDAARVNLQAAAALAGPDLQDAITGRRGDLELASYQLNPLRRQDLEAALACYRQAAASPRAATAMQAQWKLFIALSEQPGSDLERGALIGSVCGVYLHRHADAAVRLYLGRFLIDALRHCLARELHESSLQLLSIATEQGLLNRAAAASLRREIEAAARAPRPARKTAPAAGGRP